MFGHEAGAFTGAKGRRRGLMEQAGGGTLFLDEISEMDYDLQAKILKAIEDRTIRRLGGDREIEVDVQFVAATNQDLEACVGEGRFRNDLYHRINVFRMQLPPLNIRKEDLLDLVPIFVDEFNAKAAKRVRTISSDVWKSLRSHDWPGNVRELRNAVERCVLFADTESFPIEWLQFGASPTAKKSVELTVDGERLCLPLDGSMALEDMDRHIIQTALDRNQSNITGTARALGTTRETLRYRIAKYGLKVH